MNAELVMKIKNLKELTLRIIIFLLIPTCSPLEIVAQTAIAEVQIVLPTVIPQLHPTATPTAPIHSTQSLTLKGMECIPANPRQTGKVVDIVDGDTIKVLLDRDEQVYTIRYIGMDTPENTSQVEYFGAEATAKNRELVYGQTVMLVRDVSETDRYRRLLRYVLVDDVFINYELVAQGFANAIDYPPDISCSILFHDAERIARSQYLGLWATQDTESAHPATIATVSIVSVNKQAEYADIRNESGTPIDLTGWELVSERGNQRCKLDGTIQSGEVLRIWAAIGQNGFSCGSPSNIWSNSEHDPAVLYDLNGQEISRYP